MIMYPIWLTNLFINNTCPLCRGPITLDDIIAIGARTPEPFEAHLREALAMILANCRQCGQTINFSTRCNRGGLIDAIHEFCSRIELGSAALPKLNIKPAPQPGEAAVTDKQVRPSIRADQELQPPSDEEIRLFLARLRRMSFKPGSKGFDRFTK
jgi:hypothetical protein